jgi:hypothetical protein
VLFMVVVPPWLLACALSLAWTWATGAGGTASTARALFSGYVLFVFAFGSRAWYRAFR